MTTTPDLAALLAACAAHPADDTPRLVLADYLEDEGAAAVVGAAHWAKTIRAQCGPAPAPAVLVRPGGHRAGPRACGSVGLRALVLEYLPGVVTARFARGMPEAVDLPLAAFVANARALAAFPVTAVALTDPRPERYASGWVYYYTSKWSYANAPILWGDTPQVLPRELDIRKAAAGRPASYRGRAFRTAAEAREALSGVCVAYLAARRAAKPRRPRKHRAAG